MQVHTLPDESGKEAGPRGEMEEPYDGVQEMWWSNREEMVTAMEFNEALLANEANFIDLPASPLWFAHEYPQVNPSPENLVATEMSSVVKFYYPMRPLPDLSPEEAQRYWLTNHGPLIRRTGAAGHILRYIQVHRYEDEYELILRKKRGTLTEPYMGHAELWFDRAARKAGADMPERIHARQLALEDEGKFIDFSRSCMWTAKEGVFVDHR